MAGCQPKRRTMLEPFQETTQNVLQCNLQDEVRRTNQKNYMQDSGIDSRSRLLLESIHSEYGVLNDKIVVRPSKLGGYGIFWFRVLKQTM